MEYVNSIMLPTSECCLCGYYKFRILPCGIIMFVHRQYFYNTGMQVRNPAITGICVISWCCYQGLAIQKCCIFMQNTTLLIFPCKQNQGLLDVVRPACRYDFHEGIVGIRFPISLATVSGDWHCNQDPRYLLRVASCCFPAVASISHVTAVLRGDCHALCLSSCVTE